MLISFTQTNSWIKAKAKIKTSNQSLELCYERICVAEGYARNVQKVGYFKPQVRGTNIGQPTLQQYHHHQQSM